jgi:hypothetical protein
MRGSAADPQLIAHFDLRGGYLKPGEGDSKIPLIAPTVDHDIAALAAAY